MKKLSALLLFLLSFSAAFAQNTTVNGTITDSDSITWFRAPVTLNWVPNPNYPNPSQYTLNGVPLNSPSCIVNTIPCSQYLQQNTFSDNIGFFQFQALDSNQIAPSGSTWQFVIQSYTSAQASVLPNLALTGATQNVTSFVHTNIKAPRFPASSTQFGGAFGYGEVEISVTPIPGGSFFNVTNGTVEVWACNATTCSWQVQAIGSFCSTTACTIQTLKTLNLNNTCEASNQAGADFEAQINTCANAGYMTQGGIITTYGYGGTTQTGTTQLTALNQASRPIHLIWNPATIFIFNNNAGTSPSACLLPVGDGSSFETPGFNRFTQGNLRLGPSAVTYDLLCNAVQDGTQESFQVNGAGLMGNNAATLAGSLLHLKNVFVPTEIHNVSTYNPHGNAVTVDNGSDLNFENVTFADGASSGDYVGTVLTLNCPEKVTFKGGTIEHNGIHNNLIVMNSNGSTTCAPSGGGGFQPLGVHFINMDYEPTPVQSLGSVSGHATNVDSIIINDPSDVVFDGFTIFGDKGAAQNHIVDILRGSTGFAAGPFEIKNMNVLPTWAGVSVIHNTYPNVAPSLQDVIPSENSSSIYTVGEYRWTGSTFTNENSTDYLDNVRTANLQADASQLTPQAFSAVNGFCVSGYEGHMTAINDSTTATPGQTITGGGTFHVMAYCNGSFWTVASGAPPGGTTFLAQQFTICASGCTYNTTICTTTGSAAFAGGGCTVGTFNWPIAFADNNYSFHCDVVTPLAGGGQPTAAWIYNQGGSNQTNSSVALGMMVSTAIAVTVQKIECTGVHN